MNTIIALITMGIIIGFWLDTIRCREIAIAKSKKLCNQLKLQFLDETVALAKIGITRNPQGRLTFKRVYHFEFSDNGQDRQQGLLVMQGTHLEWLELPSFQGKIIETI